jgi:hypothetical protein
MLETFHEEPGTLRRLLSWRPCRVRVRTDPLAHQRCAPLGCSWDQTMQKLLAAALVVSWFWGVRLGRRRGHCAAMDSTSYPPVAYLLDTADTQKPSARARFFKESFKRRAQIWVKWRGAAHSRVGDWYGRYTALCLCRRRSITVLRKSIKSRWCRYAPPPPSARLLIVSGSNAP